MHWIAAADGYSSESVRVRRMMVVQASHRVLKLARTFADLAKCDDIAANHVAEAVQYRPRVEM